MSISVIARIFFYFWGGGQLGPPSPPPGYDPDIYICCYLQVQRPQYIESFCKYFAFVSNQCVHECVLQCTIFVQRGCSFFFFHTVHQHFWLDAMSQA